MLRSVGLCGAVGLLAIALMTTGGAHRAAHARSLSACRGPDQYSANLVEYIQRLVTDTDSETVATRTRYGLPVVDSASVTAVTDSATCRAYGDAYSRLVNPAAPMTGRRVYVVKVGPTRAVVVDPEHKVGEWDAHLVVDSAFQLIAAFAG